VAAALLHRLSQVGIRLRPLIETVEDANPPGTRPGVEPFRFVALTPADIDDLIELGTESNREEMLRWFDEGKLCYGLRDGDKLVANSWCDLDEVNFAPVQRRLGPDEAYLFAAYTDPTYRGRDLAPKLRHACYAQLRALGRRRIVSYSEPFNLASRRFKQKLGAVEVGSCVHVDVFGLWSRTFALTRRRDPKKREAGL
jgi:GNAT superfamily N-acetyltransferase